MTVLYMKSFLLGLYQSLMSSIYFKSKKSFSPSMPHKLYQMQRIAPVLPLYHHWKEHQTLLKQTSRETYMTHWSMKRPTYLVQSD